MKKKKISITALVAALSLFCGVTTVFATSASADPENQARIEESVVMARQNRDGGPFQYSVDNGATWISEADYNSMYPMDDIVWWTYDGYKSWLEEYRAQLQSNVDAGAKYKDKNGQWVTWTQEHMDAVIQKEEEILESIKNGGKVSKTINGDSQIVMMEDRPMAKDVGVSYGFSVVDENGEVLDLGEFSSKEEQLSAVREYYGEQVESGKMSQEEAERNISNFHTQY